MRLIDADALQKEYQKEHGKRLLLIDVAPTIDAVEVVRCENCKWCYDGYCSKFDDLIPFGHESYEWRDFYCSYGERREE